MNNRSNEPLAIIILAAGQGKRMGGSLPKVLASTSSGGTLVHHVLRTAAQLSPDSIVVVTGHKREMVENSVAAGSTEHGYDIEKIQFAHQEKQIGTGDAVKVALEKLKGFTGNVLILYGDVPLIKTETLEQFLETHAEKKATLSLISATTDSPGSYGRILRDEEGEITKIREARDCTPKEYLLTEINTGIYVVDSAFLIPAVEDLESDNAQGEYYLTDIVEKAATEGQVVSCHILPQIIEAQGVNTNYDLGLVNDEIRRRKTEEFLLQGVTIKDPKSFFIEGDVTIETGVVIGPQVTLSGTCNIESGAIIEGNVWLKDVQIKKNAHIKYGLRAEETTIGEEVAIGPFAHLRPGSVLEKGAKVGNFVELKKTHVQEGAKIPHLSYVGDAEIGEGANLGAGTITCNYDGYKKSKTVVGKGAFVGSNSSLVAPIEIGEGATVGAGSTITKKVQKDALALTRAEQREISGWSKKKRERNTK